MNKNNNKFFPRIFGIIILLIIFIVTSLYRYTNKDESQQYIFYTSNSWMYYLVEDMRVDFYRLPDGESVVCPWQHAEKEALLCEWKFRSEHDPLIGWIDADTLIKK